MTKREKELADQLAEVRSEREKSRSAMDKNVAMQRQLQGQQQALQSEQQMIAQDIERCNGAEMILQKQIDALKPKELPSAEAPKKDGAKK